MIKQKKALTLNEAYQEFILYKKSTNLTATTREGYELVYEIFLDHNNLDGNQFLSTITEQFIRDWVLKMETMELKLSSINHYLGTMRVFLYWLMDRQWIRSFKIHLVKGQEPTVRYFTDEEIQLLVRKPAKTETFVQYRTWVVICFVLATGARASTVINIKISDVDFIHKEITYRHQKNKSLGMVPLSDALAKVLREYLNTWSRENEDGWLFCGLNESQCTVSALHQALMAYCENRGIKSKGMHALRHAYARGYITNGGNPMKLQKLLSHSTMEMTKRYVRLFGNDLKQDYESFSPLDSMLLSRKATVKKII